MREGRRRRGWPATRSTAPTRRCARPSAATGWGTCWRSRPTAGSPPTPGRSASTSSRRMLPARAWQQQSAGSGSHGHRMLLLGVDRAAARRPRPRHRTASPADPPQRPHRGAGLPALLQPAPGAADGPGARRRATLAHRGILPGRQGPHRPRPAPGPALDLLAPLDHPGHARPRLPRRGHRRRTRHPIDATRPDHVDRQRVPATVRRPPPRRPHEPWPACCTGHTGADDTNTEPANATTDASQHQ